MTTNDGTAWTALAKTTTDGKAVDALMLKYLRFRRHDRQHVLGRRYLRRVGRVLHEGRRKTVSSTCFAHTQTESVDLTIRRARRSWPPITVVHFS